MMVHNAPATWSKLAGAKNSNKAAACGDVSKHGEAGAQGGSMRKEFK